MFWVLFIVELLLSVGDELSGALKSVKVFFKDWHFSRTRKGKENTKSEFFCIRLYLQHKFYSTTNEIKPY